MVSVTASTILTANYTTTSDCPAITVETIVDVVIDYINNETGASIQAFRDVAHPYTGTSTITVTTAQYPAVMAGAALMLQAYSNQGPNVTMHGASISMVLQDPHYAVWSRMLRQAMNRLRGRSFQRT